MNKARLAEILAMCDDNTEIRICVNNKYGTDVVAQVEKIELYSDNRIYLCGFEED